MNKWVCKNRCGTCGAFVTRYTKTPCLRCGSKTSWVYPKPQTGKGWAFAVLALSVLPSLILAALLIIASIQLWPLM
jgi:hypothetical protein